MSASCEPTDRDLWLRIVEGDEAAFSTVYDRYAKRLLNYACRQTGSLARAEDVVSLVMLETWRRRRAVRFGDDGSMTGWLFRTAHYVLANEGRATRRHRDALERAARLAGDPVPVDPDRRLIDEDRLRLVLAELEDLPKRDREAVALAAWSGLRESEIAMVLGIPTGTLKSRLSRARTKLAARADRIERLAPTANDRPNATEVL